MSKKLLQALPPARTIKILVVGDLILDEFLTGSVSRISPEAPVPVLESTATHVVLGGAANVANNLAALGCDVVVCGVVGTDAAGDHVLRLLRQRGIDVAGVVRVADRPTTHKLRVVAHVQHMLRIDREVKEPMPPAVLEQVEHAVTAHLTDVQGVVCSDYKKGVLTPGLVQGVIRACNKARVPVTVDPKGFDYQAYVGAHVLTPNLHEVQQATGMPVNTPVDIDRAAAALLQATQARAVLVTCGKDGMVLYEREGQTPIAAQAREVYDVTGAGDTVIAAFSLAYLAALRWLMRRVWRTLRQASWLANWAPHSQPRRIVDRLRRGPRAGRQQGHVGRSGPGQGGAGARPRQAGGLYQRVF